MKNFKPNTFINARKVNLKKLALFQYLLLLLDEGNK